MASTGHGITVSVIIPTFNYGEFIARAINSVMAQTVSPRELIIIDDGSTDNTGEIIRQYDAGKLSVDLIYHKQENQGVSVARNEGIKMATGDYLLFLDADDELFVDALENLLKVLNPDTDMSVGQFIYIDPQGKTRRKYIPLFKDNPEENFMDYLKKKYLIQVGCMLLRRSVVERIRFSEYLRVSEDRCLCAQLLALCKVVSVDKPVVKIHGHDGSLSKTHEYTVQNGLALVDAIFNPDILPPELLRYRDWYFVRRSLSLFRRCYKLGYYEDAERYYYAALKKSPLALFRWGYLRKYLRMKLKSLQKS